MSILNPVKRGLAVVACASLLGVFGAHAADPYKINVILPLTGGAAFLGKGGLTAVSQVFNLLLAAIAVNFIFHGLQLAGIVTIK